MESKKLIKSIFEPKRAYFVQIGFVFSLVVMLLILELMYFFSASDSYFTAAVKIEMPIVMGSANQIKPTPVDEIQPVIPELTAAPSTSLVNIIADRVMAENDTKKDTTSTPKNDTLDTKKLSDSHSKLKTEPEVDDTSSYTIIEEQPSFPGGKEALLKFLGENIKYPPVAKQAGIYGAVYVSFLVEKDGLISNVKVTRGIGGGCNEEALRVVNMMPKWTPGKKRGKPIRCQIQIPLVFFLSPV